MTILCLSKKRNTVRQIISSTHSRQFHLDPGTPPAALSQSYHPHRCLLGHFQNTGPRVLQEEHACVSTGPRQEQGACKAPVGSVYPGPMGGWRVTVPMGVLFGYLSEKHQYPFKSTLFVRTHSIIHANPLRLQHCNHSSLFIPACIIPRLKRTLVTTTPTSIFSNLLLFPALSPLTL